MEGLADRLEKHDGSPGLQGIEKRLIAEQALVTPSCGTGSLSPEDAELVYEQAG